MNKNSDVTYKTMGVQKHIALIAHDNCKNDLIDWIIENKTELSSHFLCGTGTTASLIAKKTGLPVTAYNSGPLGGDQQIGSRIAEGKIDFLIFFWDPLAAQPHDPDVKALLRVAVLYDIPVAMNKTTADFLLRSPLMKSEYARTIINYEKRIKNRVDDISNNI
ncbi:MAG TPA: methylglyoxal synthase [Clostridiales bacterium]|nr:methylglyoxal synthase [Clostridiales bacterium]